MYVNNTEAVKSQNTFLDVWTLPTILHTLDIFPSYRRKSTQCELYFFHIDRNSSVDTPPRPALFNMIKLREQIKQLTEPDYTDTSQLVSLEAMAHEAL